jgi:hypothetical protein
MTSPDQPDPGRGLRDRVRRFSLQSFGNRGSQREPGEPRRRFSLFLGDRGSQRQSGGLLDGWRRRLPFLRGRGSEHQSGSAGNAQFEPVEEPVGVPLDVQIVGPSRPGSTIDDGRDSLGPAERDGNFGGFDASGSGLGTPSTAPPSYGHEEGQVVATPANEIIVRDRDGRFDALGSGLGTPSTLPPSYTAEGPTDRRTRDEEIDAMIDGLGSAQLEGFIARATSDYNHALGRTELDTAGSNLGTPGIAPAPSHSERLTDGRDEKRPTEERPTDGRDSATQFEPVVERVNVPPQQQTVVHGRDQWQPVPADLDVAEISAVIAEGDARNRVPSLSTQERDALAASRREELRQEAASAERIHALDLATDGNRPASRERLDYLDLATDDNRASRINAVRQQRQAAHEANRGRDEIDRGGR